MLKRLSRHNGHVNQGGMQKFRLLSLILDTPKVHKCKPTWNMNPLQLASNGFSIICTEKQLKITTAQF